MTPAEFERSMLGPWRVIPDGPTGAKLIADQSGRPVATFEDEQAARFAAEALLRRSRHLERKAKRAAMTDEERRRAKCARLYEHRDQIDTLVRSRDEEKRKRQAVEAQLGAFMRTALAEGAPL